MSWELSLLSNWTSAGGQPLANLGPALAGSTVRRELGARGQATLVLDAAIAWELATARAIVRVDGVAGGYAEFRVAARGRQTQGSEGTQFTITGHPRIYDLADSDLVREVLGGRTIFSFNENLPPRTYGDRFLWVNQASDRLIGIRWGVVEFVDPVPLQWERWTRGELLAALVQALDAEVQWRIAVDGAEEVDLLRRIGADAPAFGLAYGGLLQDHQLDEDFADLMTVARVAGEKPSADSERATIAENLWVVNGVRSLGAGRVALTLHAPISLASPLLEDGQYCAHPSLDLPARYLDWLDGSAPVRIEETIAAASEFIVTAAAPALGTRVQIVADATGAPLETLELPSAIEAYGYVARDLQIPGGRGERQYARNGGHEQGLALWSAANAGAGAEYLRTELGRTFTARANGVRAAGTGSGTPFAIDGLEPLQYVRRGMQLVSGGTVLSVVGDALPDATGALSLTVAAPGLPGDFPDNAPFVLERRETRTLLLNGDQSVMAPWLAFQDSDTDLLARGITGSLAAAVGGFTGAALTCDYVDPALSAGAVRLSSPTFGSVGALEPSTYASQVFRVLSSGVPSIAPDGLSATLTAAGYLAGTGPVVPLVAGVSRIRWRGTGGEWNLARVTAIVGDVLTLVPENRPTLQIPSSAWFDTGTGFWTFDVSNGVLANGSSWTFTIVREARTLLLNGLRVAGTTVLPFKPQALIATRNWLSTDTLTLRRSLSATLDITSSGTVSPVIDEDPETGDPFVSGWTLVCDYNPATSTLDEVALADYPAAGLFLQAGASALWRLESLVAGVATFARGPVGDTTALPVGVIPVAWTRDDTYALSAGASWGTNGQVTLSLAAAVPTGRTYARGLEVRSNWHATGQLRLFAQLTGGATTVQIGGVDTWFAGVSPTTARAYAVYRVVGGSTIPLPGNVLYAAATVRANGAGQADVLLQAANPNTIPDNDLITITVPALLPPGESPIGSALRLFCPVGGSVPEPFSTTPGQGHALFYVRVPAGATRQVTVRSLFTLSAASWFAPQGPVCAIVNGSGAVLGWSALDDEGIEVEVAPGVVELTTRAVISESGLYAFRVYGGHATDFARWCLHLRSMWYVGEALDAPYSPDSFSTPLMLTALRRLAQQSQPRITDRLLVAELASALAPSIGVDADMLPAITLGGTVVLEDWDRTVRVTVIEERPNAPLAAIEVGQLARDGAQLLGSGAIAAGVRRIR